MSKVCFSLDEIPVLRDDPEFPDLWCQKKKKNSQTDSSRLVPIWSVGHVLLLAANAASGDEFAFFLRVSPASIREVRLTNHAESGATLIGKNRSMM